ncbi:hypothetical protein D5S17_15225 [Pseudonocardiaceae bacterium YIM PH 21723]|nr:hypothetical protein D5S17_15225 [Pseudonocardiaceae bacterium YIM PH 21723]
MVQREDPQVAGTIRVKMSDRRITSITLGPDIGRELSGRLRAAVNDVLPQALAESPRAGDPGPDLAAIGDQLTDVARESGETFRRIQGAVEESMAKLAGKARIQGDASPQYVDFLFDDALQVIRSMQDALAGPAAPVTGEGRDEADEVIAVVTDGELTELTLSAPAQRMTPGEVGRAVAQAVNAALTAWERRAEAAGGTEIDPEALRKLSERAGAIREQSMQHLRTYTSSMTSIMHNLD